MLPGTTRRPELFHDTSNSLCAMMKSSARYLSSSLCLASELRDTVADFALWCLLAASGECDHCCWWCSSQHSQCASAKEDWQKGWCLWQCQSGVLSLAHSFSLQNAFPAICCYLDQYGRRFSLGCPLHHLYDALFVAAFAFKLPCLSL